MIDEFAAFLTTVDPDDPRLIIRWIDEMSPVVELPSGYTVKRVVSLTVTARVNGGAVQKTFEGLKRTDVNPLLAGRRFRVTFISGNKHRT